MALKEGEQVDALPVQLYGWNYDTNQPVKIAVNAEGEIEVV